VQDFSLETEPAFLVACDAHYLSQLVMSRDILRLLDVLDWHLDGQTIEEVDSDAKLFADLANKADMCCRLVQIFFGRLHRCSGQFELHSNDRDVFNMLDYNALECGCWVVDWQSNTEAAEEALGQDSDLALLVACFDNNVTCFGPNTSECQRLSYKGLVC